MQKALAQMNIQLANVISDVAGETGQRIIRAIVAGERDPHALAAMKHGRIRASRDEIAQSLHGHWRTEHLFALRQALAHFDPTGRVWPRTASQSDPAACARWCAWGRRSGRRRNSPQFDLRTQLFQMCGVDLTGINGIEVTTALAVLSEIGADLSRFPSVKHFTSWLGLSSVIQHRHELFAAIEPIWTTTPPAAPRYWRR